MLSTLVFPLPWLLLKGFFLTLSFLILLRPLSVKWGIVDSPGGRKKHKSTVPLIGGWAIFLGFTVLFLPDMLNHKPYAVFWVVALALVVISALDDIYMLRAHYRFVMHCAVILLLAVWGDTALSQLGDLFGFGVIVLGWGGLCFTSFAVVGIINAINMMDGLDGLTACVSLVELGLMLWLAIQSHLGIESTMIVLFMGALLAFLLCNFPAQIIEKYKIFLGDAGSTLIGLLLAWLCMRLTQRVQGYPPALMLWLVALPLMDTLHLMINRKARGVSAFKPDRRHIHHILLQLNFSPKQIVLLLSLSAFFIGLSGISLYRAGVPEPVLFYGMAVIFSGYSVLSYLLKKQASQRKILLPTKDI